MKILVTNSYIYFSLKRKIEKHKVKNQCSKDQESILMFSQENYFDSIEVINNEPTIIINNNLGFSKKYN